MYFDVLLKDCTDAEIAKIKRKLAGMGVTLKVTPQMSAKDLTAAIAAAAKGNFTLKLDKAKLTRNALKQLQGDLDGQKWKFNNVQLGKIDTTRIETSIENAVRRGLSRGAATGNRGGDGGGTPKDIFGVMSEFKSVFIGGFLGTMVKRAAETIGNFEQQLVALKAILQSDMKGGNIFNEIKTFAVKSPFTFQELTSYAKQLTAFQIPYNELFDTTKRLADLSAGLGVDMGRIILAYGQVRSAAFLRGQELRQFTEAGIPMVQALADKFTELEGSVVSTGAVFDKISNREVSFEMVKSVIDDLTSKGGKFYQMQEKQAETLKGKIANLADAYDVMLNEIGKGGTGAVMKSFLDMATGIMGCTKAMGALMSMLAAGLAVKGVQKLVAGFKKLSELSGTIWNKWNIAGLAAGAVAAVWTVISDINSRLDAVAEGVRSRADELTDAFQGLRKATEGMTIGVDEIESVKSVKAVIEKIKDVVSSDLSDTLVARIYGADTTGGQVENAKAVVAEMEKAAAILRMIQGININGGWWRELFGTTVADRVRMYTTEIERMRKDFEEENAERVRNGEAALSLADYDKASSWARFAFYNYGVKAKEKLGEAAKEFAANLRATAPGIGADTASAVIDQYVEALGAANDKLSASDKAIMKISLELETNSAEKDIAKRAPALMGVFLDEAKKAALNEGDDIKEIIGRALTGDGEAQKRLQELYGTAKENASASMMMFRDEWTEMLKYLSEQPLNVTVLTHFGGIEQLGNVETEIRRRMYNRLNGTGAYERDISTPARSGNVEKWMKEGQHGYLSNLGKDISTYQGLYDNFNKEWNSLKKEIDKRKKAGLDYKTEAARLDEIEAAFSAFGWAPEAKGSNKPKKSGSDKWLEEKRKELGLLEKYIQTYKKLLETYGKAEALRRLDGLTEFSVLRDGRGRFLYGSPADGGEALRSFRRRWERSATTKERRELMESVGIKAENSDMDDEQKRQREAAEKLRAAITENTKKWDMYKKLLDATGDGRTAARLAFGTDSAPLGKQSDALRAEIERKLAEAGVETPLGSLRGKTDTELAELGIGKELGTEVQEYFKLTAKENDEMRSALVKAIEGAKRLDEKLAVINRKAEETRAAIDASGLDESEKARLRENQERKRRSDAARAMWEDFKESDDYVRAFDDMDRMSVGTLRTLLDKLLALQPKVGDNAEAMKSLRDAVERIKAEVEKRTPFGTIAESIRDTLALGKMKAGDTVETDAQSRLLGKAKGEKVTQDEIGDAWSDTGVRLENSIKGVTGSFEAMESVLGPVCELLESLGEGGLKEAVETVGGIFGSAAGVAGGMNTLAATAQGAGLGGVSKAIGAAGPWAAAAGAGLSLVGGLFALHDKAIQKEIDASERRQKEMERLSENLKSVLEDTMGGIYAMRAPESMISKLLDKRGGDIPQATRRAISEAQSNGWDYYDTAYASLLSQRDEAERQLELEREKKKKDKDAIADAEQELQELGREIEQFAKDMADDLYGIDFKSWANDLAGALVDAWAQGADAAKAYKDTINGILRQVATSVIQQSIIEQALQPVMDDFMKQFAADKGKISDAGMDVLSRLYSTAEEAAKSSFEVLDRWNEIAKKNGSAGLKDSEASSVSSGIKNITEETADLLVSYVNSIRADVAAERQTADQMLAAVSGLPEMSGIASSQLAQLRQIAAFAERSADAAEQIKAALDRVMYIGANGYRIRV